jgi:signal transduction histidine kinase
MPSPIDILLVDDEPRNLDVLEAILADPGYRLLRAGDADRALRVLLENDVAAIVLDIKMPGVNGLELAQMIKSTKRFRQTPIVFLTAYLLDDQHIVAGYDAGAVDYLTKPVNPQILRHKVAIFAELFRKTRELGDLNAKLEERVRERTAELERSEAALKAAARQKDEFLAVLAHELRNPLAPLRTGLDLLVEREANDPVNARAIGAMDRQLSHMVRLIDDLLDISRFSRGLVELKKEMVDLKSLIEATVEGAQPLLARRGHTLELDELPELQALADPTRVAQIVTNLLNNAAKFTPPEGKIRLSVAREGANVVIRVVDSGIGIPAEQLERVFEMFTRIDRAGVASDSGLGIGLALARRLAELHGGRLIASSPGVGRGSTFTLSLPALAATEKPAPAPAPANGGSAPPLRMASLKVLVIEDNEDVADTLAEWLEAKGHRVWVAHSGQTAIGMVQEARPNVVLCDLGLPEMGGVEVCRRVRTLPGDCQPVMVALTGWGREEDRRVTKEAGFDYHLVKPVPLDKLQNLLRTVQA